MDRRRFLAALAGLGALSAGCLSPLREVRLSSPSVDREDDGETHLHFSREGERLATITVRPGRDRRAGRIPVDVHVWHREGTRVEEMELDLRAPPGGAGVPAEVALTAPSGMPRPDVELYVDPETGGTTFEARDLAPIGKGTVTFEFIVTPVEEAEELLVDADVRLREKGALGRSYRLEGRTRVPLPL